MRALNKILLIALSVLVLSACKTTGPYDQYKDQDAKQIFTRGEKDLAKRRYESADKDYEALDALYPFGDYAQQGQLDMIYSYYKAGEKESALAATDRYIRLYPRDPHVDYAYYMKGLIDEGDSATWLDRHWIKSDLSKRDTSGLEEAFKDFAVLLERFPHSKYAPDARKRMLYIRNILAQHELHLAQFYFDRKAYIAAANRANEVVEQYEGSPQVITALAIMVKSYDAVGETKMADNARRLLLTNYPDSKEAKNLKS